MVLQGLQPAWRRYRVRVDDLHYLTTFISEKVFGQYLTMGSNGHTGHPQRNAFLMICTLTIIYISVTTEILVICETLQGKNNLLQGKLACNEGQLCQELLSVLL